MSTPVSKLVRVNILSSPTFPARAGFGLLMIAGISARLPLGERMRFYSGMTDIAADFSATDDEYKAAQVFFSQSPQPTQIAIGRRFPSGASGELLGSANLTTSIASWQAVTSGGLKISIDGTQRSLASLNFSSDANLNAVAARVQAALVTAGATGATVVYDGKRMIVRSGTTGATSTVSYATAPASGTDISAMLGLDSASNGKISAGLAAESVTNSLDNLQAFNASWYGLALTSEAVDQDKKDAAAWIEAQVKVFACTTNASASTDGTSTTDLAYYMKATGYRRTFVQYSSTSSYAAISAFARAFTVDFTGQNTTLTLMFKQEPGVTVETLTETQRLALEGKNCNYYTQFGASPMLATGTMANGVFFDEVHGLDWLQNAIQTNVFGLLYTSPTKIPQTDKGVARLVQAVNQAMQEAVNNGLLAPGVWNGAPLGQVATGDFLPKGYYTYAQAVADQNQSDRSARKAPPIQVIAKGAGAIHGADISVTFQR